MNVCGDHLINIGVGEVKGFNIFDESRALNIPNIHLHDNGLNVAWEDCINGCTDARSMCRQRSAETTMYRVGSAQDSDKEQIAVQSTSDADCPELPAVGGTVDLVMQAQRDNHCLDAPDELSTAVENLDGIRYKLAACNDADTSNVMTRKEDELESCKPLLCDDESVRKDQTER